MTNITPLSIIEHIIEIPELSDYEGSDEESSSSSEDEVMVDDGDYEGSDEEISSSTKDEVLSCFI